MALGKILVAQGGGPTAVINQSLVGVVLEARRHRGIDRVYGARHGVRGIVNEDFVDLTAGDQPQPRAGRQHARLGAGLDARQARPEVLPGDLQGAARRTASGTSSTSAATTPPTPCASSAKRRAKAGYPLRCIHIPKTIDNDLVAQRPHAGLPVARRASSPRPSPAPTSTTPRCPASTWRVVMGRHAGFLTAASALGRKFEDDGPHLIYVPERTFEIESFLADVKATHERHGRCVIAVSEGIHDASGKSIAEQLAKNVERDAHGNVQLSGSRRAGRPAVRPDQGQARHQARARRHLRLPAAQLPRLRERRRPARGPRGRREGGAVRDVGRPRRLGGDQAHRLLRGRLPARAAGGRGRQDEGDGRCLHRPLAAPT